MRIFYIGLAAALIVEILVGRHNFEDKAFFTLFLVLTAICFQLDRAIERRSEGVE